MASPIISTILLLSLHAIFGSSGIFDWNFCTSSDPCSEGQGDCDRDNECQAGLSCGKNNCQKFNSSVPFCADCCHRPPGTGTNSDWSFCSRDSPCGDGQGDCDGDAECGRGLTCGKNNCKNIHLNAHPSADCCFKQVDCKCGKVDRTTRIVGGVETEVNEYPWQIGLVRPGSERVFCGGSLISNRWILTAAHCTVGSSDTDIEALLGEHDYQITTETKMVRLTLSQIINHPKYDPKEINFDFSLLKLNYTINFSKHPHIRPICLPTNATEDYEGFLATITGWGTLSSGGSLSSVLMEVDVTVLSNSDCKSAYGYSSGHITNQMLCANVKEGGKDACQGDSGGPLITCKSTSGCDNYELIGVVSWGIGCALTDYPGVYARVTQQLDWIRRTTSSDWSTCPIV